MKLIVGSPSGAVAAGIPSGSECSAEKILHSSH